MQTFAACFACTVASQPQAASTWVFWPSISHACCSVHACMQVHFMLVDQFHQPLKANTFTQAYIKQHATITGRASGAGANRRAGNQVNVSIVEDSWQWGVGTGTSYVNAVRLVHLHKTHTHKHTHMHTQAHVRLVVYRVYPHTHTHMHMPANVTFVCSTHACKAPCAPCSRNTGA